MTTSTAAPGVKRPVNSPVNSPVKRPVSRRRIWCFRLATATLVPALLLGGFELMLRVIGYGHPTSFFLEKSIQGRSVAVENIDFGRRFFPTGLAREPLPSLFPTHKSPDTYRIFVLGESAAMGYPGPSFSFARILEVMLRNYCPQTRFEVINTGTTAVNSHVILPITRDCADQAPDLFILYIGNNEVVGPYGASGVLGPAVPRLELIRAAIRVQETRTGELVASLVNRRKGAHTPRAWNGMIMFSECQVRYDDPAMELVYEHFDSNLRDIIDVARNAGAQVMACTVASNLRDSPPFGSSPSPDLAGRQAAEWTRHFDEGVRREAAGDHAAAVESYELAAEIDAHRADLQFRLARSLLACGKVSDAQRHFLLARDLDTLRFRADTRINATIRAAAAELASDGVHLVDIERACALASPDELPGENLFYEHVHLNFAGNYLIARHLFEKVLGLLPPALHPPQTGRATPLSLAECAEQLAFTDWGRSAALQVLAKQFTQPPFSDQLDGDERTGRVRQELARLKVRLDSGGMAQTIATYHTALARAPDDFMLRMDFAFLLMSNNDFDEATRQILIVQEALPHHPAPHVLMANLMAMQHRRDDALAQCAIALKLQPGSKPVLDLQTKIRSAGNRPIQ